MLRRPARARLSVRAKGGKQNDDAERQSAPRCGRFRFLKFQEVPAHLANKFRQTSKLDARRRVAAISNSLWPAAWERRPKSRLAIQACRPGESFAADRPARARSGTNEAG